MKKIIAILIVLLYACQAKQDFVKPKKEKITESVYASGFIKSKNQYQAFPTVSGSIVEIYVKEGDTVNVGTPLFRIYNGTVGLNKEQAKLATELTDERANELKLNEVLINIENAKNKLQNDSIFLDRQQKLWAQQIGSKFELEQRELAVVNSKNNYQALLNKYTDLKRQLGISARQSKTNVRISAAIEDDFVVKSQIKGIVYAILKEKGELAAPQTPLAILGDANRFTIEMLIDEYDIARIALGQKVFVSMDSHKGEVFEAELKRIIPIMNERSKSFSVEAEFIGKLPLLYPNLTIEANILIRSKENALTLPRKYLLDDAFVIKKNGEKVPVKIGLRDYQKVEILTGISENDEIILQP